MRFVFGVGSKLFFWETTLKKVAMRTSDDDSEEEEDFKAAPPMDPHGTLNCHAELSPQAIFDGASVRRFGFHGGEKPGG